MQKFYFFIMFLLELSVLFGQTETFSGTYHVYKDIQGYGVFEEEDGYVVFAPAIYSQSAVGFLKFDFTGRMIDSIIVNYPDSLYMEARGSGYCRQIKDGEYVFAGFSFMRGDTIRNMALNWFRFSEWDTINTIIYPAEEDEIAVHLCETADKGYLIAGYQFTYGYSDNGRRYVDSSDLIFIKTDSLGNFEWKKILEDNRRAALLSDMDILSSGEILLSYIIGDDIVRHTHFNLSLLDSNFQVKWERSRPIRHAHGQAPKLAVLNDSTFVFGGAGKYSDFHSLAQSARLFAYNYAGDSLWYRELKASVNQFRVYDMQPTSNGGLVGCGWHVNSVVDSGGYGTPRVFELDVNGKVLWDREYWDGIVEGRPDAYFSSIMETSDGGFLATGRYSTSNLQDGYPNDVYVMKLDSLGCLQFGCDSFVYTSTFDKSRGQSHAVFPNPARESVTIRFAAPAQGVVEWYDTAGRRCHSQKLSVAQKEVETDTSDMPPGIYFLILKTESGKESLGRVVVLR